MSMPVRVLVAEDEPDTLRGLERALGKEGYHVDAVGGGIEAAERLDTGDFALEPPKAAAAAECVALHRHNAQTGPPTLSASSG